MAAALTGEERRRRLARTRVYLIVTQSACRQGLWKETAERALLSGAVGMVQLREKEISDEEFVDRARVLARATHDAGALLILNDRVGLVHYTQADGVHVGEDDVSPLVARTELGPDLLVGTSAHDLLEIEAAHDEGADYVGLGPCFATTTKTLAREPKGPALVASVAGRAPLPFFAIGGITRTNVGALARAGADRVAVAAGILRDRHPRAAARAMYVSLTTGGAATRGDPGR